MDKNQNYTTFGGWLMVWYWCLIIGGILILLTMIIPALISIAASFLVGIVYALGILISIASVCVSAVFEIKTAIQMKARKVQFFDTLVLAMLISLVGGILSNLLTIRGAYGVGRFIASTIGSIIGVAIGLCLCIMYFSKSVRVNVYFSGRPLQSSHYWNWIKLLPAFIISDTMPDPNKMNQMGNRPQQQPPQQPPYPPQQPPYPPQQPQYQQPPPQPQYQQPQQPQYQQPPQQPQYQQPPQQPQYQQPPPQPPYPPQNPDQPQQ